MNGQTGTNSGTGTGVVTLNGGGTLGGTGRIGGSVTVNPNATIRGGASGSIGTLTIGGNLTTVANTVGNGAAITQITVNATTASLVQVNGSVNFQMLGAAYVFDIQNGGGIVLGTSYTRTISTAAGGYFQNGTTSLPNGTTFTPGTGFTS